MPTLPNLTVTDAQLAKCVGVFGDAAGYRTWLKEALRDEVARRTARALDEAHNTAKRAALAALETDLPPADVKPADVEPVREP